MVKKQARKTIREIAGTEVTMTLIDDAVAKTVHEVGVTEVKTVKKTRAYWNILGPGLTTGASDDDPSGIATYSQTGAQFGFQLLWLSIITFPLMAVVQEMCARIGIVTGRGLAGNIRAHFSRRVLYLCTLMLFAANAFNIGADLGAMAKGVQLLRPGLNFTLLVLFFAAFSVILQVYLPYARYAHILKWLALVLLAYVASAIMAHLHWSSVLHHAVTPSITWSKKQLLLICAILGTTISPYLFFWQTSQEVENEIMAGKTSIASRSKHTSRKQIGAMRLDVWSGMVLSNLVMFFIIAACAALLFTNHITNITSAAQAAEALRPFAGNATYWLFAIGIIGTGLLAIPVLAGASSYAAAESFKWREGLYRKFNQAHAFYGTIILSVIVGLGMNFLGIDPIKALIYSAVANGIVAPLVLALIVIISSNQKIMGKWVNKRSTTWLGWGVTGMMVLAGGAAIWSLFLKIMDTVFSGLSLVIVVAAAVALLMRLIGQPQIIGYILTGIIVGPAVFHITKSPDTLALFSDLGIALLLFIIGLGLNPQIVKEVSRTAAYVGLIQVGFITALGTVLGSAMGLNHTAAAFLGFSLAISSTIIILKMLSDKHEQSRLYGKIAISVSLVQDLAAIVLVVFTSAGNSKSVALGSAVELAVKGLLIGVIIFWVSARLLPQFHKLISDSQEFLFLFAIAWGLGAAALFQKIGLSSEIGALLAGICLAPQPYAQEVASRLRPLRDFFVIVFFIALGANLNLHHIGQMFGIILVSALVVIVAKPLVSMAVMGFLGYTKRTSFKASVALAQVSEFSIVLVLLAQRRGLIDSSLVTAITFITLTSIAASSYLIIFSDRLFHMFERFLGIFERSSVHEDAAVTRNYEMILFGYQKGGHEFVKVFRQLTKNFVVIDYDPEMIDVLESRKIHHIYGDATDVELLEEANVAKAKLVVSTITDIDANLFLLKFLKRKHSEAVVIAEADSPKQAGKLYDEGASYVILPHFIGGEKIGAFVRKSGFSKSEFKRIRDQHIRYLKKQHGVEQRKVRRAKLGHTVVQNLAALTKAKA